MNPDRFSWAEDQQVTVTNPTSEDFTWKVHGKEYRLNAGKSAKMPGFIAWLYVYNQAVKAAQADGVFNRWNDEGFQEEYYERFVAGVDELVQEVVDEPEPAVTVFGDEASTPAPGTGTSYEPKVLKRGRPAKI